MTTNMIVRIDSTLKGALARLAASRGMSASGVVRDLVAAHIEESDMAGYIDTLWERTGTKLRGKGASAKDVPRAIAHVRAACRQ